jgi:hypothetical protein
MSSEDVPSPQGFRFKPTDFERLNPAAPDPAADPTGVVAPPDIPALLRQNAEHDRRAGWYHVPATRDAKQRRRLTRYLVALVLVDLPLGWIAWGCGHTDPFPFVAALAGLALYTSRLTWETWFLRTD